MHLFSQIYSFQLLMFCLDDQEFVDNLDYAFLSFLCNIFKVNHLYIFLHLISFFFWHTRSLLIPNAHVYIKSIDCILLSSLELKAILLTSSVNTLYFSLLYLCCDLNINLLSFMNSLWFSLRQSISNILFPIFILFSLYTFPYFSLVYFVFNLSCF